MTKTSKDIVKDLLKDASYYWYDDNEDNVNPLNPEDYDPIVDKIFKANAVELGKLYAEIGESRKEVVLGLSKSLVPDQSLLPEPGYTVAQIKPQAQRVHTTPEDKFQISGQSDTGEQFDFYFTPLFEHQFPRCEIAAILTERYAIQVEGNDLEIVKKLPGGKMTAHIWLGLNIGKTKENDTIPFFLGNKIADDFDKNHHVFHNAQWLINGETDKELKVIKGIQCFDSSSIEKRTEDLLELLEVPDTYEKQIFSRFRSSFLKVTIPTDIADYKYRVPPFFDGSELTSTLEIKQPLCWIKLELPLALPNDFLIKNILYPNCIPLVNRQMIRTSAVKSNYDRILLPMPTTDFFLGVHKIQDVKNKEDDPETSYQQVDFLNPDSRPGTFILRSGSRIRRLNREDATQRIYRLMEVIQDEYSTFKEEGVNRLREDFDVIEKSINRIKANIPTYFREDEKRASYFCIANFRAKVKQLYYAYWETQGEAIRHLGNKTGLKVNSNDINIADSQSVIPIQKGKGELTSEDYMNQLKISLLSRGRIMTKGDIELYCLNRYGQLLRVEAINRTLMMLEEGKRGRGILVTIKLIQRLNADEAEYIRIELQNDLNAKSAFFTHIKVVVNDES